MSKKGKAISWKSPLESIVGWGIVAVFLILPLIYFPNWAASYVTSKQYFLIGIVEVLFVLWVWLLLIDRRYRLSKKNAVLLLPIFLFLASLTISAFAGVDPATSFFSKVESGTGLILLYHVFIFACITASVIRVQQQNFLKHIVQANFLASVVLAVATFFTGPNGLFEINSAMLDKSSGGAMMGNSLLVGAYFIFSVFLTLYLITHESKIWKKVLYWLGIAIMTFSPIYFNAAIFKGVKFSELLLSAHSIIGQARIAVAALIIGLFLSLFIWLCTYKEKKPWRVVGIIGIITMVIIGGMAIEKIASPNSSFHTFFVNQSGNRIIDWQEGLQGIKQRPLLGWGPENYHVVYQQYLNPIVFSLGHGNEVWALHPHNNTLEVLVNGGVIGFIFYLLVLASLFGGLLKLYRKGKINGATYALFIGMLVAFIIQQQMIYDSIVSYTMFFFIIAIVAGLSDQTNDPQMVLVSNDKSLYIWCTVVAVLMIPIWIYAAYLPARKMEELQRVAAMTAEMRTKAYKHLFRSAGSYALDTDAEFFTDPLFYSYDADTETMKANPTYQKIASAEIQSLITAVNPVWQKQHYDYHLTLSLINLENLEFYLTGDKKQLAQADIYAKRAFVLSPTDPQIYTAYAQTLTYEGNTVGAKESLNMAIALNPNYR